MIEAQQDEENVLLLSTNFIGRLAYMKGKSPNIVPITYFYDIENNCVLSYAKEGHKIEAMRENPTVSFQVDDISSIQKWRSVQAYGVFQELESNTAKDQLHRFFEGVQDTIASLKSEHPKFIQDFSTRLQQTGMPLVYRIAITNIVGKVRNDAANP